MLVIKKITYTVDSSETTHLFSDGPVYCKLIRVRGFLIVDGEPNCDTIWEIRADEKTTTIHTLKEKISKKLDREILKINKVA